MNLDLKKILPNPAETGDDNLDYFLEGLRNAVRELQEFIDTQSHNNALTLNGGLYVNKIYLGTGMDRIEIYGEEGQLIVGGGTPGNGGTPLGVDEFIELLDTPSSFGTPGYVPKINDAGTALEWGPDCPAYLFIKATGQSGGDLHLSDGTNWNVSKAKISTIRIETASTDWDLYLLQNDNGYATDDANIPMMQIMDSGNGNLDILLDHAYEDEDGSGEVHLYYLDNSGSNTADIYIIGYELA